MNIKLTALGIGVACLVGSSASAAIVDDFTSTAYDSLTVTVETNLYSLGASAAVVPGPGILHFSTDAGVTAEAEVAYTGLSFAAGLDQLELDVLFLSDPFDVLVNVNGTDLGAVTISSTGVATIDVSSLIGSGLSSLTLTINDEAGATGRVAALDVALASISIVPEPASFVMAATGLGLILGRRRK